MGFPRSLCADMSGLIISSNSLNAALVPGIWIETAPRHISHNRKYMVSSCLCCFWRHCPLILIFLTTFPPCLNQVESNWVRLKGGIPLTHTLIKIGAPLECEWCLWIVGVWVSHCTRRVWVDTHEWWVALIMNECPLIECVVCCELAMLLLTLLVVLFGVKLEKMANFCFNYESKIGHVQRDVIYVKEIWILYSQLLPRHKSKQRYWIKEKSVQRSRVYYSNSSAGLRELIRAGDIELNPGPLYRCQHTRFLY